MTIKGTIEEYCGEDGPAFVRIDGNMGYEGSCINGVWTETGEAYEWNGAGEWLLISDADEVKP